VSGFFYGEVEQACFIKELKGIMDESARELLRQILGALDDLWLNEAGAYREPIT
jgi:hypothetical protein